ncbi:GNAT family N-acetyltransferase [Pantoea agglomerans]|uniref:GNAT family N-acetyltransferase n=1 Tax=Enterobacter agglomerans TaxID=549 RepID=UPI00045C6548|nr:GNAT family N-acetyltransferase [Pantoea agglomerans]KDA92511.1 hypothetical protein T296_22850 [Pantoea agglomerans Eh318]
MCVIKKAELVDVDNILNLQQKIWEDLDNKKNLQTSSKEFIEYCISIGGVVYLIYEGDVLIGYRFIYFPKKREFNLGRGIIPDDQLETVAHLDTTCLLKEFRGKGIGKDLAGLSIDFIAENKMQHVLATVAPNNIASMKVMFYAGLKIVDYTSDFNEKERYIFHNCLTAEGESWKKFSHEMAVDVSSKLEIVSLLKEKWVGIGLTSTKDSTFMILQR